MIQVRTSTLKSGFALVLKNLKVSLITSPSSRFFLNSTYFFILILIIFIMWEAQLDELSLLYVFL